MRIEDVQRMRKGRKRGDKVITKDKKQNVKT